MMKKWIYWLVPALVLLAAGCGLSGEIKDGRTAYQLKRYNLAAGLLQSELPQAKDAEEKFEITVMIADSYRQANDLNKAESWYGKAVEMKTDIDVIYQYALVLKANEKYEEAIAQFNAYLEEEPFDNTLIKKEINAIKKAEEWRNEPTRVTVEAVTELNTPSADFGPAIYKNEAIAFTSSRNEATGEDIYGWTGEQYGDIFIASRANANRFNGPESISALVNTPEYEGTATFTADFNSMYFSRCTNFGDPEQSSYCYIYTSTFDGSDWSEPEMLMLFEDTCNAAQPTISRDGKTLMVASDIDAGFGGWDIYYFKMIDGEWSSAYNAGTYINTDGDELFPYLDKDNNLYFASDGHYGMGGLDIYKAVPKDNTWGDIENMRYPINSGGDDFGLVLLKHKPKNEDDAVLMSGYLSSSRKGGKGSDDIYYFQMDNKNLYVLKGVVLEKEYEDPEDPDSKLIGMVPLQNSLVELRSKDGGKLGTVVTDEDGRFEYELQANSDYKVYASKENYFTRSELLTTKGKKDLENMVVVIEVELELERIWPVRDIEIPNIYYDYDDSTLRAESFPTLDSLVNIFKDNPGISIEIGSHTDSRGSASYNENLSQGRANSVVKYLVEQGIAKDRLKAVGYGESKLVNDCADGVDCTEEEHQLNRRTTFKVLGLDFELESTTPNDVIVDPKDE